MPELLSLARAICRKEGLAPTAILPLTGGQVNHVYRVENAPGSPAGAGAAGAGAAGAGAFVLRIGAREDARRRLSAETALLQRFAERFPRRIPVARVVAFGEHEGHTYQIQQHVPGERIYKVWATLSPADQERIAADLAQAMQVLHAERVDGFGLPSLPGQGGWVGLVGSGACPRPEGDAARKALGEAADAGAPPAPAGQAPSAPPEAAPGSASQIPADPATAPRATWAAYRRERFYAAISGLNELAIRMAPGFIDLAQEFFEDHASALDGGAPTLVHGDLNLTNILVDGGRLAAILDFEYALHAPADYELLPIEEFCLYPNDFAEEDDEHYTSAPFGSFCMLLRKHYPTLFETPRLGERLALYHLDTALNSYLAWRKDNLAAIPPERMAAKNFYMARITNAIFGHGVRMF